MLKPYLQDVPIKYEDIPPIRLGGGENTFGSPFEIQQSESRESRNVSSRLVPALSVRPGRADSGIEVTTPNILGQRNNQYIHVLDGTAWKYWDGGRISRQFRDELTSATREVCRFLHRDNKIHYPCQRNRRIFMGWHNCNEIDKCSSFKTDYSP